MYVRTWNIMLKYQIQIKLIIIADEIPAVCNLLEHMFCANLHADIIRNTYNILALNHVQIINTVSHKY